MQDLANLDTLHVYSSRIMISQKCFGRWIWSILTTLSISWTFCEG